MLAAGKGYRIRMRKKSLIPTSSGGLRKDVGVLASTGNTFAPLAGSDIVNCLGTNDNCLVVDFQLAATARDEVPVLCSPSIVANADPLGSVVSPELSTPLDPCNQTPSDCRSLLPILDPKNYGH
ncbi:hypothetical protein Nepgr_003922 [Nepenthes gracilis]|uniref:Uncharacterized protein n=1 Tax=Nepenthes gracilis TaxID=150966 RepID=A0AAD3XEE1_NEPGR|nr:hypothetical protein Nepgr_003922 [Nepenthes gracilis]